MRNWRTTKPAGGVPAAIAVCLLTATTALASNLLGGGNAEQVLKSWKTYPQGRHTLSIDPIAGRRDKPAAFFHLAAAQSSATAYTYARLTPLHVYALDLWYKPALKQITNQTQFSLTLNFNKKGGPNGSAGRLRIDLPLEGAPAWRHHQTLVVAPADAVTAQVVLGLKATDGGVWIDEIQLNDATEAAIPRITAPPTLDGKLDDPVWKSATLLAGFWPSDKPTQQASALTTAWMAYDDDNLYIAFRNEDPNLDHLRASVTQRDGNLWSDDCVEVFIVPPEAHGVHLSVNSLNTQGDLALVPNAAGDIKQDKSWNGQWQSAVAKTSDAWSVEMKIPFTTLKAHPKAGAQWKINLCRERYTGLPHFTHWNRATGGFANLEKFATLRFEQGGATLLRFVEDLSRNPLAIERPNPRFQSLLGENPGNYPVSSWSNDMYLSQYPDPIKKKYSAQTWKPRAYEFLEKWGRAGMDGPAFPWAPMAQNLGWEMVQKLHEQFGMRYRLVILNSSLDRKARQNGAKWFFPDGDRKRVAIIDPKLLEAIESFAGKWVHDNPRALELIHSIEGIDEPSNGLLATFSPTKRPDMTADLALLDQQIRQKFGHGKFGLYDDYAPADETTPFKRIAFLKWWNHNLADAIGRLQLFFKKLTPDKPFMGFDINSVSAMNPTDITLLSPHTDWASTDPYPTATLALYGRARALYHTGFTTKLLKDLGQKPLRVICQGFIYYGRGPTPADVREWASQALKNGADGLMWYESGPANLTIPEAYDETIRINGLVHRMNKLELPKQTHTAIFFSQVDRWGRDDKPMDAAYTLYTLLGERLGSWFNFVSDTQLSRNPAALDDYTLIYLPSLTYVDRPVAQRLIDRARAGATLVIFDPQAFTWATDGSRLSDLRQSAGGAPLDALRHETTLLPPPNPAPGRITPNAPLPLTPLGTGPDKGRMEAFTLGTLPGEAAVIATYADGAPAAYQVPVGKGSVIWFAAQPFGNADLVLQNTPWQPFLAALAARAHEKTDLPLWHFLIPPPTSNPAGQASNP